MRSHVLEYKHGVAGRRERSPRACLWKAEGFLEEVTAKPRTKRRESVFQGKRKEKSIQSRRDNKSINREECRRAGGAVKCGRDSRNKWEMRLRWGQIVKHLLGSEDSAWRSSVVL